MGLLGTVEENGDNVTGERPIPRAEWLPEWVPNWSIDLFASILIIVLAWAVARLLVRLFGRRIARHIERPSLTGVVLGAIKVGVYFFALIALLRINGLDLGSIALSVTVFSAVVGVILAPIVGSIISGIFLLADQPYEIGDMIELTDQKQRGFVDDITLRYTKIFTLDNTFLVIPNGEMRKRDVINYSAEDTRLRDTLDVLITYESDLKQARERMEASARNIEGVISGGPNIRVGGARYPAAPQSLITNFDDNGILLRLRYWIQEPYRLQTVRSQIQTEVWDAFKDTDVEIAYPHSHLMFDETSGQLEIAAGDEQPLSEEGRAPVESGRPVVDRSEEDQDGPR